MPSKEKTEVVDLDSILQELGQFGRYQRVTYCFILVPITFSALFMGQYIFSAGEIPYRCTVPECESAPLSFEAGAWALWALPEGGGRCSRQAPLGASCDPQSFHINETQPCNSWVYEHNNTIVAEFDLACHDWKRTLVGTIHNAGVFLALPLTAYVSDTFGRRMAFVLTATMGGVVGVARSFSISYIMYVSLEFLEAVLGAGLYSAGFVLALEMVGMDRRVLGGNIISCTFALGQVLMALMAWAAPYWRTLTLIVYIPSIFSICYFLVLEESVRWLLSKGRKKEAARIIFKAAEMNKRKLSPATIKLLSDESSHIAASKESTEAPSSSNSPAPSLMRQVLRSRTLMTRVLICSAWWITITFIYYGLSINSVSLAGNRYVNYILISLVEIPGYALSFLTLDRYGRKTSIITAFFVCGAALLGLPFLPSELQWARVSLNMTGKLAISMAFSSIYIYTSELMPTQARQSLLSACSMVGRIGSLLAPQTPLLMSYWESLPYLLFGVMAAASGLLMLLTPETLRMRLPDTVQQAEDIDRAARAGQDPAVAVKPT